MGNRKQITKKVSPLVTMLRSDYDILVNVYEQFGKTDLSEEEVSFLMGKEDGYFFGILDPTEKTRFKEDFIPLFVPIFKTTLESILPDEFYPDEEVKITATAKFNKKSTVYRHTVIYADEMVKEDIEWKKKVVKGERKKENEALTTHLEKLIANHYFILPRKALHLLIDLHEQFTEDFTIADLKVSLGKLTRAQGGKRPPLQRNNDDARFTYSENYYLEPCGDVSMLAALFGISGAEISGLTIYTIANLDRNTLGFIGLDGRKLMMIHVLPEHHRTRLATRMVDFVVALDKANPVTAEVPLSSPVLRFLEACGFKESLEDKKQRTENAVMVVRLNRSK